VETPHLFAAPSRFRAGRPCGCGLRALPAQLQRRGLDASDLELQRLLAFDPGRRSVLAAFAPLEGQETLVGLGAIENGEDLPDVLVVDERLTSLSDVLGRVLAERARARRAA
jgi:hypothetical protein